MALYIASNESNARFEWSGDIKNPALATQTVINGLGSGNDPTSSFGVSGGGFVATTAAYDGFTIYPATGNITGTIQVYGYNQ